MTETFFHPIFNVSILNVHFSPSVLINSPIYCTYILRNEIYYRIRIIYFHGFMIYYHNAYPRSIPEKSKLQVSPISIEISNFSIKFSLFRENLILATEISYKNKMLASVDLKFQWKLRIFQRKFYFFLKIRNSGLKFLQKKKNVGLRWFKISIRNSEFFNEIWGWNFWQKNRRTSLIENSKDSRIMGILRVYVVHNIFLYVHVYVDSF